MSALDTREENVAGDGEHPAMKFFSKFARNWLPSCVLVLGWSDLLPGHGPPDHNLGYCEIQVPFIECPDLAESHSGNELDQ